MVTFSETNRNIFYFLHFLSDTLSLYEKYFELWGFNDFLIIFQKPFCFNPLFLFGLEGFNLAQPLNKVIASILFERLFLKIRPIKFRFGFHIHRDKNPLKNLSCPWLSILDLYFIQFFYLNGFSMLDSFFTNLKIFIIKLLYFYLQLIFNIVWFHLSFIQINFLVKFLYFNFQLYSYSIIHSGFFIHTPSCCSRVLPLYLKSVT